MSNLPEDTNTKTTARRDFIGEFVADIGKALEEGTAPWCKPWKAGELAPPCNPVSGTTYSGMNFVRLAQEGLADPRYMTFNHAQKEGFRIKKGEKGRPVVFWSHTDRGPKLDEKFQPVLDDKGKPVTEERLRTRPIMQYSTVFHASQIEGIDPWQKKGPEWASDERAEAILRNSGAQISHEERDKAFYSPAKDSIHLRDKSAFPTAADYYSTALHELAHWTGHKDRMNRDMAPKGTLEYAKEELRAEIAAWMMATKLGLPFDPEPHRSYVESWAAIVKDEPKFVVQACSDAEKICAYCLKFEHEKALEHKQVDTQQVQPDERIAAKDMPQKKARPFTKKDTRLQVPYVQKDAARAHGAMWDAEERTWFAPAGTDLAPLTKWLANEQELAPAQEQRHERALPTLSPEEEFAQTLKSYGLDLKGELPIMDGVFHRVAVENGKPGAQDGSYMGYRDGRPAGTLTNFKTGEQVTWKYSGGHTLSAASIAELTAKSKIQAEAREQARTALQEQTAKQCQMIWEKAAHIPEGHPYLVQKGVDSEEIRKGLKIDQKGNILVPLRDTQGTIRSLQTISVDPVTQKNTKRFTKNAKKSGMFHLVDPENVFDKKPIILAEGLATAASINKATGLPVSCVFDAGNLIHVARQFREQYPDKPIIIMADNDSQLTTGNVGLKKAHEVRKAVSDVFVCTPRFTEQEQKKGNTDFNDFQKLHGVEKLKEAISDSFCKAKEVGNALRMDIANIIIAVGKSIQPAQLNIATKNQGMSR